MEHILHTGYKCHSNHTKVKRMRRTPITYKNSALTIYGNKEYFRTEDKYRKARKMHQSLHRFSEFIIPNCLYSIHHCGVEYKQICLGRRFLF